MWYEFMKTSLCFQNKNQIKPEILLNYLFVLSATLVFEFFVEIYKNSYFLLTEFVFLCIIMPYFIFFIPHNDIMWYEKNCDEKSRKDRGK